MIMKSADDYTFQRYWGPHPVKMKSPHVSPSLFSDVRSVLFVIETSSLDYKSNRITKTNSKYFAKIL